jgi:WD40 repeat protein
MALGATGSLFRLSLILVRDLTWSKVLLVAIAFVLIAGVGLQPEHAQAKPKAARDLYVTSWTTNSVQRYDGDTGASLGAFVSSGSGGLINPHGLTFGPDGHLYVTSETNAIMRYNGTTGAPLPASGQSGAVFVPAGSGGLSFPYGLTFGPDGNLYVASANTNQVLRYNGTTGAFMNVFVAATPNGPNYPSAVVFGPGGSGDLYVAGLASDDVRRFNRTTGAFVSVFASGNGLFAPGDLLFEASGNLLVSSSNNNQVLRFNSSGTFLNVFVASGNGLARPFGMAFSPTDGNLLVVSQDSHQVLRYNGTTGAFLNQFVTTGSGGLNVPKYAIFGPAQQCINTTVAITSHNPNPSLVGQLINVCYTVTPASGGAPSGNVTVTDGTVNNTCTVAAGCCALTPTTAGAKNLFATYSPGAATWCGSASAGVSHTVQAPSCTTMLTSSPNPATVGQPVTLTANVASTTCTPTGTVTFREGNTTLCTATINGSGQATCTISTLTIGSHTITATWSGSQTCQTSCTSSAVTQIINAVGPVGPSEVPEGDTILLFGAGAGGLFTWLGWQWRKVRRIIK